MQRIKIKQFTNSNEGGSDILTLLYTGMRVGELETITYDDTFIYCERGKQERVTPKL